MIQEYPDYFLNFSCIGGACEDSCCIGWEVDIDEESYCYYQTLEGPFGDLIRSRISVSPDGDYYFPMAAGRRCPFLNQDNLCDMILHSGEEALCMTCDEYPRYFNRIGDYEQVDISLSCMEAGRLLFSSPEPVTYIRSHLEDFREEYDPEEYDPEEYDPEDCAPDKTDSEPEEFPAEGSDCDRKLRSQLIRERDAMIAALQDRSKPIHTRILDVITGDQDSLYGPAEKYPELLDVFRPQEALDRSWRQLYKELRSKVGELTAAEADFYAVNHASLELWFEKLAVYFTYRYYLDAYFDGDTSGSRLLTIRSLQMIWLLLILRWLRQGRTPLSLHDMIDTAHIYSRQTEHCEENVEMLKVR